MKCVIDKSSLIIKIVALIWLIFVVLNWIEFLTAPDLFILNATTDKLSQ